MSDVALAEIADKIVSLNLVQAAELVRILEEKIGMPVGSFAMGGGGGGSSDSASSDSDAAVQTEFEVIMHEFDAGKKISVIKELRAVDSQLALKDAMDFVASLPKAVIAKVAKDKAEEIKQKLIAAGATKIEIK